MSETERKESGDVADLVVFCDESGAKGYADQQEHFPGETGVFAGFFVPREYVSPLEAELRTITDSLSPDLEKPHITDISAEHQQHSRNGVYKIFLRNRVPCFYEAIYVQGFHADYERQCKALRNFVASTGSKLKKQPQPESLHTALFLGFYTKILDFCLKRGKTNLKIEIRTDKIDSPILKKFHQTGERFLCDERKIPLKKWNPETQSVVYGSLTLKHDTRSPFNIEDYIIAPTADDNGAIFAADVLANSFNYLLRQRERKQRFEPLNCREAVASHPLISILYAHPQESKWDFADHMYAHPRRILRPGGAA